MRKIIKKFIDTIKPDKKPYHPGRMCTQEPPQSRGRYRIIGPNGKIEYSGICIADRLQQRKKEHTRTGKFDPKKHKFAWSEASKRAKLVKLREQEKREIKKHQPDGNINVGGGGRSPKKKGIRSFLKF